MHRSSKPHAQAKKVPPPAIPGDPISTQHQHPHQHPHQHQQQFPLYRLGGSIAGATGCKQQKDDGGGGGGGSIIMSSLVTSPSLDEVSFNLPRETSVALRMKDEIDYHHQAPAMPASAGGTIPPPNSAAAAAAASAPAISIVPIKQSSATNPLLGVCPTSSIVPCPPVPAFCTTLREPLTHKAAVYYHQQLALQEDQGIDLTQSPGRDSPGSSSGSAGSGSRHSTASLDSGRASSYLTGVSGAGSIRGSSGGGSAGGALSSPRCSSVSSCSIGSVDRQRNDELIIDWLIEMKCEEYAQLFIAAGYDLPTIARMTPEDLTAIGIKNPHHRERIKQRIDKLQVLDNLPHFVPGSIEEWLQLLRLEEYIQPLLDQNYKTVRDVTQVTWEDLEDIGIVKLGHQKKILLAIKRVKDIISGKWNPGGINAYQQGQSKNGWPQNGIGIAVPLPVTPPCMPLTRVSWDDSKTYASFCDAAAYYCTGSNHECCSGNDVVLIKVRQPRGKSLESLEDLHDNSTRSHLTFSHYTTTDYGHFAHPTQHQHHQALQQQQFHHHHLQHQQQAALMGGQRLLSNPAALQSWRRSYDDGDITPTNDATRELMYEEGGGTLPRQQRGILQRAVLNTMPPIEHHHYMNAAAAAGLGGAVGGISAGSSVLDSSALGTAYLTSSPMANKKIAPEPPRRHCSIRNSRALGHDASIQLHHHQQQQHHQQQLQQSTLHNISSGLYYGGVGGIMPSIHHPHGYMTTQQLHHQQQQQQQQQQQTAQPIYANYATIQQTTAEIHCEKFHDNKSNSSIDSIDTIPFANENTGTIKQRLLNRQDVTAGGNAQSIQNSAQQQQQHLHSSSSSSSSSSTNTIANITHSFHSLKSSASLHDASLIRSDSIGSNTSGGSAGAPVQMSSSSMVHLRSPTLQYPPIDCSGGAGGTITTTVDLHAPCNSSGAALSSPDGSKSNANATGATTSASATGPPKVSVNVLNDIGNMLANLTDELDAMLEEEKRAGLNIDSE